MNKIRTKFCSFSVGLEPTTPAYLAVTQFIPPLRCTQPFLPLSQWINVERDLFEGFRLMCWDIVQIHVGTFSKRFRKMIVPDNFQVHTSTIIFCRYEMLIYIELPIERNFKMSSFPPISDVFVLTSILVILNKLWERGQQR